MIGTWGEALSKIFTLIRRIDCSFDIKSRIGGNLKVGASGVMHPFFCPVGLDGKHARNDRHALGSGRAKMIRARRNNADTKLPPVPFTSQRLDLGIKVLIVTNGHGSGRYLIWSKEVMVMLNSTREKEE